MRLLAVLLVLTAQVTVRRAGGGVEVAFTQLYCTSVPPDFSCLFHDP